MLRYVATVLLFVGYILGMILSHVPGNILPMLIGAISGMTFGCGVLCLWNLEEPL